VRSPLESIKESIKKKFQFEDEGQEDSEAHYNQEDQSLSY